ncbi:MAG: hypothetical protein QM811_20450 [Pirellulales bacterium]
MPKAVPGDVASDAGIDDGTGFSVTVVALLAVLDATSEDDVTASRVSVAGRYHVGRGCEAGGDSNNIIATGINARIPTGTNHGTLRRVQTHLATNGRGARS